MNYSLANNPMRQYQQVKTDAAVDGASPHRLIQMLLEGALERVASAKGYMQRRAPAGRGEEIGKAIAIIGGLRNGLDDETGGEIAGNLDALYDYVQRRLVLANVASDTSILDEVSGLLRQIKEAWDTIGG